MQCFVQLIWKDYTQHMQISPEDSINCIQEKHSNQTAYRRIFCVKYAGFLHEHDLWVHEQCGSGSYNVIVTTVE